MLAIVSTGETRRADLLKRLRERKKGLKADFIKDISVKKITALKENPHGPKVAILDLGVLNSFVAQLKSLGCNLTVVPYATDAEEILGLNLDGLVVSNGPEEDEALPGAVETVRRLLGKIPLLGISTGHEIICRALGGKLKKMKLGHHGVNYPVRSPDSHKGEITVQNHSFIANESSIKRRKDIRITMRNVNDNSIEEMESGPLRFISAQYYPTSPGFGEVNAAFKRFVQMIRSEKGARGRGRSSTVRETGKDKERNSRCQSAKI
jgi:carbamoyl-phosphate synthase small subunit